MLFQILNHLVEIQPRFFPNISIDQFVENDVIDLFTLGCVGDLTVDARFFQRLGIHRSRHQVFGAGDREAGETRLFRRGGNRIPDVDPRDGRFGGNQIIRLMNRIIRAERKICSA